MEHFINIFILLYKYKIHSSDYSINIQKYRVYNAIIFFEPANQLLSFDQKQMFTEDI